jgi:hypothetical protein
MMIRGYEITARMIAIAVAVLALVIGPMLVVRSCDKRHSQAAQERVEDSQAQAASNSAADAIATVSASGEAERASEDLTRANDRDIRAAEGAEVKVGAGVNAAGLKALCKRAAYRSDPKCKGAVR